MTRPRSRHWTAIGVTSGTACLVAQTATAADDAASQPYHAALTDHVPGFITAPGQTDYLFIAVIVLILLIILAIGNFYFQLHAVPERIAHRANKAQLEVVAVLALISLFTHNHIYWIIGLLLAMVRIPDFSTPLYSIARSIARLANRSPEAGVSLGAPVPSTEAHPAEDLKESPATTTPYHAATGAPAGAPTAPGPAPHPQPVQQIVKTGTQREGI
ncbi:hypothetical protein FHX08_000928 [Rhizobium sp. BK529]|uniref:hypothetical protein n=1 Tax=Rhizobium sp. BK529 TaxID=2586983 RepID=UPI00161E20C9|nr:hypothetical protein [Rhizobium sp. BK418]MBB3590584.1 hypothetical protein [Rhizobium sp. BK529]